MLARFFDQGLQHASQLLRHLDSTSLQT
ncbi:hypothetical protein BVI1335_1660003 [Burkholderia vietnamiensis]|nr:hypothetical protein BVI1335_1660003 [Burkholderia vietnamiensis]